MGGQRTHTLAKISDRIATTPYAGRMIQGVQDAAWKSGYIVELINTGDDADLATAGVFDQDLLVAEEADSAGGERGARELLGRPDRPTALFCYNDRMAMGAPTGPPANARCASLRTSR